MGFTTSLQGDLQAAGLPIRAHVVCPDAADTDMVRERAGDPDAAALWSLPLIEPAKVAERTVSLLDRRQLVLAIPASRAWLVRALGPFPRITLKLLALFRWMGERRRPPVVPVTEAVASEKAAGVKD